MFPHGACTKVPGKALSQMMIPLRMNRNLLPQSTLAAHPRLF